MLSLYRILAKIMPTFQFAFIVCTLKFLFFFLLFAVSLFIYEMVLFRKSSFSHVMQTIEHFFFLFLFISQLRANAIYSVF